jgi:hypothetical protein
VALYTNTTMIPKRIADTYTYGTVVGSRDIHVMSTDPHVQLDLVVFGVIWQAETWTNLAGGIALRKPRAITWTTKVRFLHDSFENLLDSTRAALANEYGLRCDLKPPEHLDLEEATIGDLVTCVRKQVYAVKGWKKKLGPDRPGVEDVKSMTPTWFAKHPPV